MIAEHFAQTIKRQQGRTVRVFIAHPVSSELQMSMEEET